MKTIFVANLGAKTSEDAVRAVFETRGKIEDVQIARDPASGVSRGVAFVRIDDPKLATDLARSMTGMQIEGHSIRVSLLSRNH